MPALLTQYIFFENYFCSDNNIIDFWSWSNSIFQILILVNLGMLLCCETFTDHPHYLHIFLEKCEENYKRTVLSVDYATYQAGVFAT